MRLTFNHLLHFGERFDPRNFSEDVKDNAPTKCELAPPYDHLSTTRQTVLSYDVVPSLDILL